LTGRHQFVFPVHYRTASKSSWVEADYITLVSLMLRELSLAHGNQAIADEFMLRVIQSCHNIACYVKARASDLDELYGYDSSFIEGEQSLLFGHLMHPTPKSRE